ncbi:nucleolar protein 58-like [Platysternon megacephalum]|uniref:Nucleolar protein 58-like n=1 Tax=Platysternon megacephalum TaxID=55544 RepID=A0A4D9E6H4_9SAUR|nr:nucleolar protein 58-like [Platysternon megacephalum]
MSEIGPAKPHLSARDVVGMSPSRNVSSRRSARQRTQLAVGMHWAGTALLEILDLSPSYDKAAEGPLTSLKRVNPKHLRVNPPISPQTQPGGCCPLPPPGVIVL